MALRIKNRPPANPEDFERLCLRVLKAHWDCPTLELYGRRGDLTLETCSALRNNGVIDSNLILYEVQTLEQYDVEGAIAALQEYLAKRPDDRTARLRLSLIGTNRNRADVVDARPDVMPKVEDVLPPAEVKLDDFQ